MLSDRRIAIDIYKRAEEIRPEILDARGTISSYSFLERYLVRNVPDFVFHVEANLKDCDGTRVHGTTNFKPNPQITLDEHAYNKALEGDPSSLFTVFHEGYHLLHHRDDPRARKLVALNRGLPNSGTSFVHAPELELEANFFAGAILVPHSFIDKRTTVDDVVRNFPATREIATRALKQARAVFQEKWSVECKT